MITYCVRKVKVIFLPYNYLIEFSSSWKNDIKIEKQTTNKWNEYVRRIRGILRVRNEMERLKLQIMIHIDTRSVFPPCHPSAARSISLRAVNKKCNKVFNMTKAFQFYLLPRSMFVSFSRSCCNSKIFPFV